MMTTLRPPQKRKKQATNRPTLNLVVSRASRQQHFHEDNDNTAERSFDDYL
jgi:hypothetical protein